MNIDFALFVFIRRRLLWLHFSTFLTSHCSTDSTLGQMWSIVYTLQSRRFSRMKNVSDEEADHL